MVAILLFAFIFMVGLALLLARYSSNPSVARAELEDRRSRDGRPRIEAPRLRALTLDLLEGLGLRVVEEEVAGDARRLIATRSPETFGGARYVVFVEPVPPGDEVDQTVLIELAETVKSERAAVGMLVTPYRISAGGLAGLDVPLEIIDGPRFRQLVATYLPERLPELDRYRGFGGVERERRGSLVTTPA